MPNTRSKKNDTSLLIDDSNESSKIGKKKHLSISDKKTKREEIGSRRVEKPAINKKSIIDKILNMYKLDAKSERYIQQLFFNSKLIKYGIPIEQIDFVDGEKPKDLPPINRIEDIDNLSKEDCITYLRGYEKYSNEEESIDLKRKLSLVVGFNRPVDREYPWSPF